MKRALKAWEFWVGLFLRVLEGAVLCTGCCSNAGNPVLKGLLYPDGHFETVVLKLAWTVMSQMWAGWSHCQYLFSYFFLGSLKIFSMFSTRTCLFSWFLSISILSCRLIYGHHPCSTVCMLWRQETGIHSGPCCSLMYYSYNSKSNMPEST